MAHCTMRYQRRRSYGIEHVRQMLVDHADDANITGEYLGCELTDLTGEVTPGATGYMKRMDFPAGYSQPLGMFSLSK